MEVNRGNLQAIIPKRMAHLFNIMNLSIRLRVRQLLHKMMVFVIEHKCGHNIPIPHKGT